MKKVLLLAALVVSGCSKNYKPIVGPDNRNYYSIECSRFSLEKCKNTAKDICPKGYDITGSSEPILNGDVTDYLPKNAGQTVDLLLLGPFAPSEKSNLQVRCK